MKRLTGETEDRFVRCVHCGDHRVVLVFLRETHGRRYVRFRYWHRHRKTGAWYPDSHRNGPRAFMIPSEHAAELGAALIGATEGRLPGPKPDWLLEHEGCLDRRLAQLRELRAPELVLKEQRRRARRHH